MNRNIFKGGEVFCSFDHTLVQRVTSGFCRWIVATLFLVSGCGFGWNYGLAETDILALKVVQKSQDHYRSINTLQANFTQVFTTHMIRDEEHGVLMIKKPKKLSFELAVLFGCAIPTGMGLVVNEAKPAQIDSCAVIGTGGIGIFSILALKALKIKKIIAIDKSAKKLNLVKKLGVKHCLNIKNRNFKGKFSKLTNKIGVDFCFEASGSTSGIELGFSLIKKKGGKLFFSSHPPSGKKIKIDPHELISGKKIFGSWGGSSFPDTDIKKYYNILKQKKTNLRKFIRVYNFKQINLAMNEARKSTVVRILLKMQN